MRSEVFVDWRNIEKREKHKLKELRKRVRNAPRKKERKVKKRYN